MKVVAVVQARMGSTRLPGKVMLSAEGKPLIIHMLERVSRSRLLDELWLATSDHPHDDLLAETVAAAGFSTFRGSQEDVLDRVYQLATQQAADVVVRLTGDCPLHDPHVVDETVQAFLHAYPRYSYASNSNPPSYPDGLDVEAFTYASLAKLAEESTNPLEREHVTLGIHRRYHRGGPAVPILTVRAPADFSHLRWTLDEPEDYKFIKIVYAMLYPEKPAFTWWDVLALVTKEPRLLLMNAMHERNKPLKESLRRGMLGKERVPDGQGTEPSARA